MNLPISLVSLPIRKYHQFDHLPILDSIHFQLMDLVQCRHRTSIFKSFILIENRFNVFNRIIYFFPSVCITFSVLLNSICAINKSFDTSPIFVKAYLFSAPVAVLSLEITFPASMSSSYVTGNSKFVLCNIFRSSN